MATATAAQTDVPSPLQELRPPREPRSEPFAVTLRAGGAQYRGRIAARAESFDEEGLRLRAERPLPVGTRVRARFDAPKSMTPARSGMRCAFGATVVRAQESELTLRWDEPLSKLLLEAATARQRRLGFVLLAALAVAILSQRSSYDYFWYNPLASLYALSLGVYFYSRFLLALIHQPPARTGYEPTLSIIVSARNEEKAIAVNVASCYAADYPAEKREVIVVDDGSTDATPRILAELKKEYPTLKTFSIPPEGKRAAMAKGIREATGELVVVLDSDTSLERDALRQIVCGFENPELGAASGYTGVANSDKNMLTRMQDVRYLVSFDLMKSSESLFGAVTCCPGCLSAYRREYLMKVLEPWLAQTFLGARATFGDDRSLTNYILRDYRVIYNPLARATTIVPETWMHYMRQQCRWKKSWLREAPIAARILARKQPLAALSFYASALCSLISPILALRYVLWDHERLVTGYVEGFLLIGFILGVFALWRRPTRHWYLAWLWIATQLVLMAPQTYWAMLTMRKNHWGTR